MQSKLFIYSWACLLGSLLVSCSKTPDGVLTQKQMLAIQVDMMKAQTLCNTDVTNLPDDEHKEALYRSVFEKHGVTQALYDSSLVWYGRNLEIYMRVCDKIDAVLVKEQRALGDIQAAALSDVKNDSVDIWPRRSSMVIESNAMFTGTTFNIKPQKSYPSGSIFMFSAEVWGLKKDMTQHPKVSLTACQADTMITVSAPVDKNGKFNLTLHTVSTKKVNSVYGYIYLNNQDSALYKKIYFDNIELMRVNYGRIDKAKASSEALEKRKGH